MGDCVTELTLIFWLADFTGDFLVRVQPDIHKCNVTTSNALLAQYFIPMVFFYMRGKSAKKTKIRFVLTPDVWTGDLWVTETSNKATKCFGNLHIRKY